MTTVRKLLRFLKRHGYRITRQSGSHIILEHDDRPMLVVPQHPGELPKGLFLRILHDAGFSLQEFRDD